jgi:hypothetical protein
MIKLSDIKILCDYKYHNKCNILYHEYKNIEYLLFYDINVDIELQLNIFHNQSFKYEIYTYEYNLVEKIKNLAKLNLILENDKFK